MPMQPLTRDPQATTALITSLDVRNNALFLPGRLVVPPELTPGQPLALYNGEKVGVLPYTRCNGLAGVVFAAMGCPIPWKTANELLLWFPNDAGGKAAGWVEMVLADAPARVNAGLPVAIIASDNPHGHIGVGAPNFTDPMGLYCAAAGTFNTACQRVADQFGKLYARARYFWHA